MTFVLRLCENGVYSYLSEDYLNHKTREFQRARQFTNRVTADNEISYYCYVLDEHFDMVPLETARHEDALKRIGNVWA